MMHIKRQKMGSNKQSDTEYFSDFYLLIIDSSSPHWKRELHWKKSLVELFGNLIDSISISV